MLSLRIMEISSSESPHKISESQELAYFAKLLEDDFSACVRENRANSTSIISDEQGTDWTVYCNEIAVEEIREEEERNLGGKKLDFDDCFDDEIDDRDEQQQEVRSLGSSVSDGQDSSFLNSSCLSEDKKVDFEEEEMKNGEFGARLDDLDHGMCDVIFEEKMDLKSDISDISEHFDANLEMKSGNSVADLEDKNGGDEKIKRKLDLVDGKKKKSEHFDANLEMKSGHFVAEKKCCDEKIKKKKDLVVGKKKKCEHFDANVEKKRSGKCRISEGFAMVTMGIIVGMIILIGFDLANFGKDQMFLVPT